MADYLTFETLYTRGCEMIGDLQKSRIDEVKAVINMVYFEMLTCDDLFPLFWLLDFDDSLKSVAPGTITGITAANPPVVTSAAHGLASGDLISIYDVVGMTEVNNRVFVVLKVDANSYHLHDLDGADIDGSAFTAYTSGGTVLHRGKSLATTGKPVQRILSASWHGYTPPMEAITYQELEASTQWFDSSPARPTKYHHAKRFTSAGVETNFLYWFNGADAVYQLRYWFIKRCSPLVNTTDVPEMPPWFHEGILAGLVERLGENKVQVEAGVIWPNKYAGYIDSMKKFNRKWWQENRPDPRSKPYMM